MMTVKELIDLLETYPKDMLVAIRMYSEQCLLEADEIEVIEARDPRPDGWIHDKRPDKPTRKYLMLGN